MVYKKAQRKIPTYTQFNQFRYISSTHKFLTTDHSISYELGIYKHIVILHLKNT